MSGPLQENVYRCKQCGHDHTLDEMMAEKECQSCGSDEFLMVRPATAGAICDFCSSHNVSHAFPCKDFRQEVFIPGAPNYGSVGWWAACPPCKKLIDRGERDLLAQRSAKKEMRRNREARRLGMRFLTERIRELHDNFWANRQGPSVEHVEAPNV